MIAYLTDVEGRWDKLASFAEGNPLVSLEGEALVLADGVTFVFGGDAVDRGPHGRRVVRTLLAAKRAYGDRVVLLAGNRDINKLRLAREIPPGTGAAPELRRIFEKTMGAKDAFTHRQTELAAEGRAASDDDVVESFREDVAGGGELRAYLEACVLAHRAGPTLFVHGAVTPESLGVVPGREPRTRDVDAWVRALNALYAEEMDAFAHGREPTTLIAYQAPVPGTRANQASIVYGRLTDDAANPLLPDARVIAALREGGVSRVVVGHTPSGDTPAVVKDEGFEALLADNAYGRVERGSQVAIDDAEVRIVGTTELDDGRRVEVRFASVLGDAGSPLGRRERGSGRLVKGRLATGEWLLFRGLPSYRVEQIAADATGEVEPARETAHDGVPR